MSLSHVVLTAMASLVFRLVNLGCLSNTPAWNNTCIAKYRVPRVQPHMPSQCQKPMPLIIIFFRGSCKTTTHGGLARGDVASFASTEFPESLPSKAKAKALLIYLQP